MMAKSAPSWIRTKLVLSELLKTRLWSPSESLEIISILQSLQLFTITTFYFQTRTMKRCLLWASCWFVVLYHLVVPLILRVDVIFRYSCTSKFCISFTQLRLCLIFSRKCISNIEMCITNFSQSKNHIQNRDVALAISKMHWWISYHWMTEIVQSFLQASISFLQSMIVA